MIRKIGILLLVLAYMLSLTACGVDEEEIKKVALEEATAYYEDECETWRVVYDYDTAGGVPTVDKIEKQKKGVYYVKGTVSGVRSKGWDVNSWTATWWVYVDVDNSGNFTTRDFYAGTVTEY